MSPAHIAAIVGRALIASLFILAGVAKIIGPKPFLAHMAQFHVPGFLLIGVIALEIGAGGVLLAGLWLPYSAGALALFCIATALVFHAKLGDRVERTLFFKDIAIAGGLMAIAAAGL
jgi:putative oxidoreductase